MTKSEFADCVELLAQGFAHIAHLLRVRRDTSLRREVRAEALNHRVNTLTDIAEALHVGAKSIRAITPGSMP